MNYPIKNWVPTTLGPNKLPLLDVLVIGGGMNGLATKGGQINLIQSFNLPLDSEKQCQRDLQELCEARKFKVAIGKVLPISEISSAHELVEAKTIIGNVVLKV